MWQIGISREAAKQLRKLPRDIQAVTAFLIEDLRLRGPILQDWKNFGKLRSQGERFHCHIKSGRPTYVACWEVIDKRIRILELYCVGTHENVPY